MIKSDAQRECTAAQIEGFRHTLAKVDREMTGKRAGAVRGSYEGMIRQLEDELREYEELKSGELTLPNVERLDQIAPFVAKMRIAKGVSQTELARRLGVSKQVISRYEETEYQTVSRLQEILDFIAKADSASHPQNSYQCAFRKSSTTAAVSTSSLVKHVSAWKGRSITRAYASFWSTPHDDLAARRHDDLDRRGRHGFAARVHPLERHRANNARTESLLRPRVRLPREARRLIKLLW